ncbi:MAG: hypothetical protein M1836_005287 [Candelina mexicana]|nr:MAG: hypothetical protein M1836_005287 [Candelina mexicana]
MAPPAAKTIENTHTYENAPPPFDFDEWERIWVKDWGRIAEAGGASPEEIDQAKANQQLAKEAWSRDYDETQDKYNSARRRSNTERRKNTKKQDSETQILEDYLYDIDRESIRESVGGASSGLHLRGGGTFQIVDESGDELEDWPTYHGDFSEDRVPRVSEERQKSSSPSYAPHSPRFSTPSNPNLAPDSPQYAPRSPPTSTQDSPVYAPTSHEYSTTRPVRKFTTPSKFWTGQSGPSYGPKDQPTSSGFSSSQSFGTIKKTPGPSSGPDTPTYPPTWPNFNESPLAPQEKVDTGNTTTNNAKKARTLEQDDRDLEEALRETAAFPDLIDIKLDHKDSSNHGHSMQESHEKISSTNNNVAPQQPQSAFKKSKKVAFDLTSSDDGISSTLLSSNSESSTGSASPQPQASPHESALLTASQLPSLLPLSDQELTSSIRTLKHFLKDWCNTYFTYKLPSNPTTNPNSNSSSTNSALNLHHLSKISPELISYANHIALGHPNWEDLFLIPAQRAALVYGILGKVLEVWVFGPLLFGATKSQTRALEALEKVTSNIDGFKRTSLRCHIIKALLSNRTVPPRFHSTLENLTLRTYTMLLPLFEPDPATPSRPSWWSPSPSPTEPIYPPARQTCILSLHRILTHAARIAINMRLEETIYYFTPLAKNTAYAPGSMHVLNAAAEMEGDGKRIEKHNDNSGDDDDDDGSGEEGERAVVKIACFPQIVAYRKGNGREGGGEDGFRTRVICRADVWLRWVEGGQGGVGESLRERVQRERERESAGWGCGVM